MAEIFGEANIFLGLCTIARSGQPSSDGPLNDWIFNGDQPQCPKDVKAFSAPGPADREFMPVRCARILEEFKGLTSRDFARILVMNYVKFNLPAVKSGLN